MEIESIKVEANDLDLEDAQPSAVKPASKALSDGSRDETPTPTYKHSWTVEQRLKLAMLAEAYSNDWNEKTFVFNHVHKSGLRHWLRKVVLITQSNHMKKKNFDAAASLRGLQATLSPYDRSNLVSRRVLEKKALDINIKLRAKETTDTSFRSRMSDKHDAPGRKRKRVDLLDDTRTDFLPDPPQEENQIVSTLQTGHGLTLLPKTPTKINGQTQQTGLLTPPDSRERKRQCLTADKRLAQIGFRAFTAASQGTYSPVLGIRAGAFLDRPTVPLARDLQGTSYIEEALHHVTKYNYSRPSMFVSATKNPMRAIHMALRGGEHSSIAVIDLHKADERGNVNKAHQLKLRTKFRYTGAGEYLIFGGVEPEAIIAHIPLSKLLVNMPTTPDSNDPFCFEVLQGQETLSHARRAIKREALPMTFSLGRAVRELVGNMCIPAKHFESGNIFAFLSPRRSSDPEMFIGVWAIVQDWKFYNAEGGKKRGHWAENVAFKDGALKGYQAIQAGTLASLDNITSARNIIEIEDSSGAESDSDSTEEDGPIPLRVDDWVRNTVANQASLQFFDFETSRWTTKEDDLSDTFMSELRDMAGNVNAGDKVFEDTLGVPETNRQDEASNLALLALDNPEKDTENMVEVGLAVHSRDPPEEFENVDELCADVMHMHGDEVMNSELAANKMEMEYEFCWTGM